MDLKGSVLKLGMITENSSVKELLLSNVHELRGALLEQGVKLERLDVHIDYHFSQSLAHSKEGASEGQRWSDQLSSSPFGVEDGREDPLAVPELMAASAHLLDLII